MEQAYFSQMLPLIANRAALGTVSSLGFASVPLRRQLMEVFSRPYGQSGSYLSDPTFEAVFGWTLADKTMRELSGNLLHPALVDAMDLAIPELAAEYRFSKDR